MRNSKEFFQASKQISQFGQKAYAQGWAPATSGNYSIKLNANTMAITVSGKHKGQLQAVDIMLANLDGQSLEKGKTPSAETLLHSMIYQLFPEAQCVLHTHSIADTVISKIHAKAKALILEDYELLKALEGIQTHETSIEIPIFDNTQDIPYLAEKAHQAIKKNKACKGFLISGHGLYTWGSTFENASRHVECLETLLLCELKIKELES